MTKTLSSPRQLAFDLLLRFDKGSSLRLKADSLLSGASGDLTAQDRGFLHALVMGTLRHWLKLDERIKLLTGRALKQMTPQVRTLLRLGLFQLEGLQGVPAYAAIDSTVELARRLKQSPKTLKFINAVLREAQRKLETGGFPVPEAEADFAAHLLQVYGWPEALTGLLVTQYGREEITAMAKAAQDPPPLTLRINTLRTTAEQFQAQLAEAGIPAEPLADLPEGLLLPEFSGSPRSLPGYEEGLFYVQDPASMAVGRLLDPQAGENVLDLAAAPGSKTTQMAALMHNTGHITAIEPKPERMKLLEENIARLGISNVELLLMDGLSLASLGAYDKVLLDAPCSGSGTLRRHPEILLHLRKPEAIAPYRKLQAALLEKAYACLKPGGVMVYSTCSLFRAENQDLLTAFRQKHKEAQLEHESQRLITAISDGFYMARLRKPAAV